MSSSFFTSKTNFFIILIGLILYTFLLSVFYIQLRESAIDTAQNNIREYLRNISAIRSYVSNMQKEEVYRLQGLGVVDKEYFSPTLLSSTFSASSTNDYYNELRKKDNLPPINISFPSANARNPKNDATPKEKTILEKMNNGEIKEYSETYDSDGQKLLYYAIPTKKTTSECMRCHTDPSLAPDELVEIYGDKRGFYEHQGDIRALLSTTYPLKKELEEAMKEFYKLAFVTFIVFLVIYLITVFFMMRLKAQNSTLEELNETLEDKVKEQTLELEENSRRLNNVIKGANIGYWDYFVDTNIVEYNSRLAQIMGLDGDELKKDIDDILKLISKDDLQKVNRAISKSVFNHESFSVEFRVERDGEQIWVHNSGGVVEKDSNGKATRLSGTLQDITERKDIEEKLRINREYFNLIYNSTPDIIVITSGEYLFDANHSFYDFFDQFDSVEDFREKHACICEFFMDTDKSDYLSSKDRHTWIRKAIDDGISKVQMEKNGVDYVFSINAKVFNFLGSDMFVVSFSDITELEKLKDRFQKISASDELTSLLNRRSFNQIFTDELQRSKREGRYIGLSILDIDFFKEYNDRYGHVEGDRALKSVALEIKNNLRRAGDFAFRLGGEEFGVVFSSDAKDKLIDSIKKVQTSIKELKIEHEGSKVGEYLTISAGVVIKQLGVDDVADEDRLYKEADDALYMAKKEGRDRVVVV